MCPRRDPSLRSPAPPISASRTIPGASVIAWPRALAAAVFGLPVAQGGWAPENEETVLAAFAVYKWRNLRRQRGGRRFNTGRHCQACVSAVRDWAYEVTGRGTAPLTQARFLRLTLKP